MAEDDLKRLIVQTKLFIRHAKYFKRNNLGKRNWWIEYAENNIKKSIYILKKI